MTELRVESEWLWVLQVYDLCVTIKDTHNSSFFLVSRWWRDRGRTHSDIKPNEKLSRPLDWLRSKFSLSLDGFWCNDMKIAVVIARWDGCFEGGNRNLVLKATKNVFWAVSKCNIVWFGGGVVDNTQLFESLRAYFTSFPWYTSIYIHLRESEVWWRKIEHVWWILSAMSAVPHYDGTFSDYLIVLIRTWREYFQFRIRIKSKRRIKLFRNLKFIVWQSLARAPKG